MRLSGNGNVQTKGVRSKSAIMLTGTNRSTRMKTSPGATVYTTHLIWTVLSSNLGLCVERPETNLLTHGTDGKSQKPVYTVFKNPVSFSHRT
jgi:hypothetical protein